MNAPRRCVADFLPPVPEDDPIPRMIEAGLAEVAKSGQSIQPIELAVFVDLAMTMAAWLPREELP